MSRKPKLGLALGGGAARGWAHFGVMRYLDELGIKPDIITGTSIGSIVGGAYASGNGDKLEQWALNLDWQDILSLMDVRLSGGLMEGGKLVAFFEKTVSDTLIENLPVPFGAVATDLATGQEVWMTSGDLLDAIRASIALPGLLTPFEHDGRWLVDGGLVNPVPVSLCRSLGADMVIAVDLNAHILSKRAPAAPIAQVEAASIVEEDEDFVSLLMARDWKGLYQATIGDHAAQWKKQLLKNEARGPSMVDVLAQSVYIMQHRITRARMAGDPPDILLTPRLADIKLMDFHRAQRSIDIGYESAQRAGNAIQALLEEHY